MFYVVLNPNIFYIFSEGEDEGLFLVVYVYIFSDGSWVFFFFEEEEANVFYINIKHIG